jgi:putative PEP-CTERM system TPR-repeat lipoprotein
MNSPRTGKHPVAVCIVVALALGTAAGCRKDPAETAREHLERGDTYAAAGQHKEAIIEYRNVVQIDPRHGAARHKLATSYEQSGEPQRAFAEYIRAADLLPNDRELQLRVTRLLIAAGRFEDAKTRARAMVDADSSNVDAQILVATATAGMRDLDEALKLIDEAVKLDPANGAGLVNLGAIQMARGQQQEAEAAFLKAVAIDPKSPAAHLALANYYWSADRLEEAERELKITRSLDPTNPLANRALAMFAIANNRAAEAEDYVKATVAGAPNALGRLPLADYYIAMNRVDDATTLLREISQDAAALPAALVRIAGMHLRAGNRPAALQSVEEILAKHPKDAPALSMKSTILLLDGKRDEALAQAQAAIAASPDFIRGHYALGTVQMARNEFDGARRAFEEVLRLNPAARDARLQLARLHMRSGEVEQARSLVTDVLRNEARDPEARVLLVRTQIAKGQIAEARLATDALAKEFPGAPSVLVTQGTLHYATGNRAAAREAFTKALSVAPHNETAIQGLVALDVIERRPDLARGRVDALIQARPNDARALMTAARAYAATGDLAGAEALLRRALTADPMMIDAYAALTQVFVKQGKIAEARAEYGQVVKRQPNSVAAQTTLGMLHEMAGATTEAESVYETVLGLDARAGVAANNLAWMLAESGRDLDRALALAKTAVSALPENARVKDTLGWIYVKKQMYAHALDELQQAVALAPNDATTHYHLGVAALRAGDRKRAAASFTEALRLNPKFEGAADAKELLAQAENR